MELTNREKVMAVIMIATILIAGAILLHATKTIPSTGTIKSLDFEVFANPDCTVIVERVNWGTVNRGSTVGITVYIKNIKNTNFTMSMNTTNWVPTIAEANIILAWNYTGELIEPNQVIPVQLLLMVNPNIENVVQFSFDININAEEVE